jgi:hypothetical protein
MSEQTAYAQSIAAAQALMNGIKQEQTEMEWLEAKKAMHKRAFRVTFDFLDRYWPPENTAEYWKMVTDRMALLYSENKENKLCTLFLLAVQEYLEQVGKERDGKKNECVQ